MTLERKIQAQAELNNLAKSYRETVDLAKHIVKEKKEKLEYMDLQSHERSSLIMSISMWQSVIRENNEIIDTLENYYHLAKHKDKTVPASSKLYRGKYTTEDLITAYKLGYFQ